MTVFSGSQSCSMTVAEQVVDSWLHTLSVALAAVTSRVGQINIGPYPFTDISLLAKVTLIKHPQNSSLINTVFVFTEYAYLLSLFERHGYI